VNEEGQFLAGLFAVVSPGKPLIMQSPPNATVFQRTWDRVFIASCPISQGIGSEGTWECDWWGPDSDFWIEVGVIRHPGACSGSVYTYCNGNNCNGQGGMRFHPNVSGKAGVGHIAKIWWEPGAGSVNSSTTGTWWVSWDDVTLRMVTDMTGGNAVFAGSRTTHARNDLGVTDYTGLHYGLRPNTSPATATDWNPFNGPFYWSAHDAQIQRYFGDRYGEGEFQVLTNWHVGGAATPTAVATADIGCNH
jgi:hypothetical protein